MTTRCCLPCWDLVKPPKPSHWTHRPAPGLKQEWKWSTKRDSKSLSKPAKVLRVIPGGFNVLQPCCMTSPATLVMAISTARHEFLDETWAFLTQETPLCWGWNGQGLFWSRSRQEELCHCQGSFSEGNLSPGRRPQWQGYMPPWALLAGLPLSLLPEAPKDTGFVLVQKASKCQSLHFLFPSPL